MSYVRVTLVRSLAALLAAALLGAVPNPTAANMILAIATAGPVPNPGNGSIEPTGNELAARAIFEWDEVSKLIITLTNTASSTYGSNQMQPSDVLTGLFFDVDPNQAFTQPTVFAVVNPDTSTYTSTIVNNGSNPSGPGTNVTSPSPVSRGWQYIYDEDGLDPLAQSQGLGTVKFDIFPKTLGEGDNGQPFNYGIVNAGYDPGEGNNAVDGQPLVRNTIVFTLEGLTTQNIVFKNFRFQYGTTLGESFIIPGGDNSTAGVPEPTSLALAGFAGITMLIGAARRRRRTAA